jgi:probable phosphoglycerate mutase
MSNHATETIMLIRHGQSTHHLNDLTGGWTDSDLTALGRRQAACLASRLKRELAAVPCRLCCSDLKRARQTADIIAQETGAALQLVPALREINNGIAAGKTKKEAQQYARTPPTGKPLLDWQMYPQAETWRQFYARVAACMARLISDQDRLLVLVTHGGTIINVVAWWLRLEVEMLSQVSFDAAPTSVSVLRVNQWNERTIGRLNDTAHLYAAGLADNLRF